MVGLTKSFAVELGPFGVRCNAIKPGYFHTSLGGGLKEGEPPGPDERGFVADLETHTPLARMADPREIAGLAVYLASDASSFVNGALIPIDGGLTSMQMPMPHLRAAQPRGRGEDGVVPEWPSGRRLRFPDRSDGPVGLDGGRRWTRSGPARPGYVWLGCSTGFALDGALRSAAKAVEVPPLLAVMPTAPDPGQSNTVSK